MEAVRWHNLEEAPCFSGGPYTGPPLSASSLWYPEPTVTRRSEYVFVARCKNCHREYHLDPDMPIPPAYCGLGITHGCGSSEWHVLKRLIEVEDDSEYVDDCVYSDLRVEKYHELSTSYIPLPPMTEKEAGMFREKWEQVIRHVRQNSRIPGGV